MGKPKATVHTYLPLVLNENTKYHIECTTREPGMGLELRFSHYPNGRRTQMATIIPIGTEWTFSQHSSRSTRKH